MAQFVKAPDSRDSSEGRPGSTAIWDQARGAKEEDVSKVSYCLYFDYPAKMGGQAAQYDNRLIIKCQAEPVCLCNQAGGVEAWH